MQLAQDLNDYMENTLMYKKQEPLNPDDTAVVLEDDGYDMNQTHFAGGAR